MNNWKAYTNMQVKLTKDKNKYERCYIYIRWLKL